MIPDTEEMQVRYGLPLGGGGDVQWLINTNNTLIDNELRGLWFVWAGTLELSVNMLHKFAKKNKQTSKIYDKKKKKISISNSQANP